MTTDQLSTHQRIARVMDTPPELRLYQRWLDERPSRDGSRDYLFTEPRVRFEPRREDAVVPMEGLEVGGTRATTLLRCPQIGLELKVADLAGADARRIVQAMDGERSLLEVTWHAGCKPEAMARLLRVSFGKFLLAPQAVSQLEQQVSGLEIARFPGSPYGIERSYWANVAAVTASLRESPVPNGSDDFIDWLRRLHVLLLMGADLQSFYQPASPAADHLVAPGALYLSPVRLRRSATGTVFFDGPRVNASLLGGARYHELLYRSLDDPEALGERSHQGGDVPWGEVVRARSEKDEAAGMWFCPPRPITQDHFGALLGALQAAEHAASHEDLPALVRHAADFHQAFVRLHPFQCGNQALAMSIVNALLKRGGRAGMPHLLLDHLALRLRPAAYQEVFRRAVAVYAKPEAKAGARLARLTLLSGRSTSLVRALAAAETSEAAHDALAQNAQGVVASLLEPKVMLLEPKVSLMPEP